MTILEAYEKFIFTKKLNGLSGETIKDYHFFLKRFISYVGSSLELSDISEELVNGYILSLHSSSLSRASVSTYIRNLRIFLCYANTLCPLPFSPDTIKVPKSPKKKAYIYSDDDIVRIFCSIQSSVPWIAARNRAIIALMLDSGIRQGEVCSLLSQDVSFSDRRIKVHGKGDKERFAALGGLSVRYLRQYFDLCPYTPHEYVFLSDDGTPLSGNAVRLFVFRLGRSLPFPLTSHMLRHNFATNYCLDKVEDGQQIDAYTLKTLMGHESITTTEGYIHCALELLAVKSSVSHLDRVSGLP